MHKNLPQLFFVLFLCIVGAMMAVFLPSVSIIVVAGLIIVWLLSCKPVIGLYILLFLYPFLGWVIDFRVYDFLRTTPWLSSINAPLADFWAVILIVAVGIYMIREHLKTLPNPPLERGGRNGISLSNGKEKGGLKLPGFLLFGLFVASALISLFNIPHGDVVAGLKYLLRNIIFFYVAFVLLPVNILQKQKEIVRCINWLLAAGLVAMLWGIASLFIVEPFWGMWRRVTPFAIGGWAPFGLYHNDLAEVFVAIIPLALFWYYYEKRDVWRKVAFLYASVLIVITLLTFSRTAWIVLFVQLFVFIAFSTRRAWREMVRSAAPFAVVLLLPIAVYMLVFSSSAYVASSTSARMDLTRIAVIAFAEHPLIGNGIGTYIGLVGQATAFRIEYGPPFDAHGVIQKLAAEQGVAGLITFFAFVGWILWIIYLAYNQARPGDRKELLLAAFIVAVGAVVYQLFNTQYYTAKMWVPLGFALAVAHVVSSGRK